MFLLHGVVGSAYNRFVFVVVVFVILAADDCLGTFQLVVLQCEVVNTWSI